jgi:hypothetical protein
MMEIDHTEEAVIQNDLPESITVKSEPALEDVEAATAVKAATVAEAATVTETATVIEDAAVVEDAAVSVDAPADMLQMAHNEFNRNRKIVIKHADGVTVEVSKYFYCLYKAYSCLIQYVL